MNRFVLCVALALLSASASAAPIVTTVNAKALDKLMDAVPAPTGSLGWHQLTVQRPCVPNFWNLCTTTLYSGEVSWSMSTPRFVISASGVTLSSTVTATFAGFTASASVNANVTVQVNASSLFVALSSVSVPVTFNLPGYGSWSPGSVTVPLGSTYGLNLPFRSPRLEVSANGGGTSPLSLVTTRAQVSFQPGALILSTEHLPW